MQNLIWNTGDDRGVPHSTSVPEGRESFLTAVTEIPFWGRTTGAAVYASGMSLSLRRGEREGEESYRAAHACSAGKERWTMTG